MKKLLCVLIMASVLLLNVSIVFASNPPTAPTIYVSRDPATATDGYYCDGVKDQEQINKAINFVAANPSYNKIHLKAGTYVIDNTIYMKGRSASSHITLTGDDGAKIMIKGGVVWEKDQSMIQQADTGQTGITISNIELDGNRENVKQGKVNGVAKDVGDGKDYYNCIYLQNCSSVHVLGMNMHDNKNDGLRIKGCNNVWLYSSTIACYHDGLYAYNCQYVEAWNNNITARVNNGLRAANSNHIEFSHNTINGVSGTGGAGIQVQKENGTICDDVDIRYNTINASTQSGMWIFGSSSSGTYGAANITISYNNLTGCGTKTAIPDQGGVGGILICGFNASITYNTINGCKGWGIATMDEYESGNPPANINFSLNTYYNNIINTLPHAQSNNTSYGIYNLLNANNNFTILYNHFGNNPSGPYLNVTPLNPDNNTYN